MSLLFLIFVVVVSKIDFGWLSRVSGWLGNSSRVIRFEVEVTTQRGIILQQQTKISFGLRSFLPDSSRGVIPFSGLEMSTSELALACRKDRCFAQ